MVLESGFADWLGGRLHLFSGGYTAWRVALELLLIGGVVYVTLRFLQGTRGARLMRAIGLIVIVSFLVVQLVARRLELDRINHLYPYFLGAVFLVALIVFQTELRRGLLRLGADWWSRAWSTEAERYVEPIVHAVANLSKRKVGALIAVERAVGMSGVAESGVQLNADTSAELLEAIFWPGSPLHDMGVIIRERKVVAASCQFPLSESDDVSRALGSRHRAAVGLSQDSDALVIVVSEETGTISLAEHGRLRRSMTPDSLRDSLIEKLGGGRKAKRSAGEAQVAGKSAAGTGSGRIVPSGPPVRASGEKAAAGPAMAKSKAGG